MRGARVGCTGGERKSRESFSNEKGRVRQDGNGVSKSERDDISSSFPFSGRQRRRRSAKGHLQNEDKSNEHEHRHSRGNRLEADEPYRASSSTRGNRRAEYPYQSMSEDERPSQPRWEKPPSSGPSSSPARVGNVATFPATNQHLPGADVEEVPAAHSMAQSSESPSMQDIRIPGWSTRDKQSMPQRSSSRSHPSSRPSKSRSTPSRSRTADFMTDPYPTPPISPPQQHHPLSPLILQDKEKTPNPRASFARPRNPSSSRRTVHPPSSTTQSAGSQSTSHRRRDSTRSSTSRTQSLQPTTFSSSQRQQRRPQTQPMVPIPESKYDPEDEEPVVFRPISPDGRAKIEGWMGDIGPGAPAPPSSVRGGREDDYDGLESVGWWESSSQPMDGSAGARV